MSGFAYNLKLSTAITPVAHVHNQEAAGKIGKIIGVIAAVIVPFAAPMVWGAIAGSGGIAAGLGAGMSAAFGAGAANIIGSAAMGAIMNAGIAFATGARGSAVWGAALQGGLGAGFGAARSAAALHTTTNAATGAGLNAVGGTGPVSLAPTAGSGTNLAIGATTGAPTASSSILGTINNIFSGGGNINRIGAALTNALVNGESTARIDALVAQQRAALQTLNAQEQAAYAQRMEAAQKILADADRNNPDWLARIRMADVAGIMNREHDQAKRNILVRQGGSLDAGQLKAYDRSGRLAIGRAKAGAAATGYRDGAALQNAGRAQAAGLMTGPSLAGWQAGLELDTAQANAHNAANQSTAAGFNHAVFGTEHDPAPSGDPSEEDDNGNDYAGIFGNFGRG